MPICLLSTNKSSQVNMPDWSLFYRRFKEYFNLEKSGIFHLRNVAIQFMSLWNKSIFWLFCWQTCKFGKKAAKTQSGYSTIPSNFGWMMADCLPAFFCLISQKTSMSKNDFSSSLLNLGQKRQTFRLSICVFQLFSTLDNEMSTEVACSSYSYTCGSLYLMCTP